MGSSNSNPVSVSGTMSPLLNSSHTFEQGIPTLIHIVSKFPYTYHLSNKTLYYMSSPNATYTHSRTLSSLSAKHAPQRLTHVGLHLLFARMLLPK